MVYFCRVKYKQLMENELKKQIRPYRLLEAVDTFFIKETPVIINGKIYVPQGISSRSFRVLGEDNSLHEFGYNTGNQLFKCLKGGKIPDMKAKYCFELTYKERVQVEEYITLIRTIE